jgi:hypothetical protein
MLYYIKVKSVSELKKLAGTGTGGEFCIALNGCRSSKHIVWDSGRFYIDNYIDGSQEVLRANQLGRTNILRAMRAGSFYYESDFPRTDTGD